MKNVVGAALVGVITVVLSLGATAQVDDQDEDSSFTEADAGSFGVEIVDATDNASNGWCAADAGSLGHPNPVGACR